MELSLQLSMSPCVLSGNAFLIVSLQGKARERHWQLSPTPFIPITTPPTPAEVLEPVRTTQYVKILVGEGASPPLSGYGHSSLPASPS